MKETAFFKTYTNIREGAVRELKGAPLSVYLILASHLNWDGESFPSINTISQETGYSIAQVKRALEFLKERGYITAIKKSTLFRGTIVYHVNHYVCVGRGDPNEPPPSSWMSYPQLMDELQRRYIDINRSIDRSISSLWLTDELPQDHHSPQQPDREAEELWEKVKEKSKDEMTFSNYNCWVQETKGIKLFDSTILVGAPSEFVKEHLQRFIYGALIRATYKALGKEVEPRFVVLNHK